MDKAVRDECWRREGRFDESLACITLFHFTSKSRLAKALKRGNLHFHGFFLTLPPPPPSLLPNVSQTTSSSFSTHTFLLNHAAKQMPTIWITPAKAALFLIVFSYEQINQKPDVVVVEFAIIF